MDAVLEVATMRDRAPGFYGFKPIIFIGIIEVDFDRLQELHEPDAYKLDCLSKENAEPCTKKVQ